MARAPDRALILAGHRFPGEYVIKVFGPGDEDFRGAVAAAVGGVHHAATERGTRSGRRICITLVLVAQTVDEVIGVYDRLHAVERLALIL
jgi:putative lipoic acid-binding regulatory protein